MALYYLFNQDTCNYFVAVLPDGSVSLTNDENKKTLLSPAEMCNAFYQFGLRNVEHCEPERWEIVTSIGSASEPSQRAIEENADTGIIGPGGNNNPNPTGLPVKPN